jgi:tRNA/rRNA methyltransferase
MSSLLQALTVVCHQLQGPDNLGAIARLLANFGCSSLTLSDPQTNAFDDARKMAVHAHHVIEGMKVVSTLDEALAHTVYACGTTSRDDLKGRSFLSPEQAVRKLREEALRGSVALVLGGEKRGLSDDELARCQDVLVIPTQPHPQPSMNLAQAAAVLLYLCAQGDITEGPVASEPGAKLQTVRALEIRMEEVLSASGFLNPQAPGYIRNELALTLGRARLTQREAELWLSAFAHLKRSVERKD